MAFPVGARRLGRSALAVGVLALLVSCLLAFSSSPVWAAPKTTVTAGCTGNTLSGTAVLTGFAAGTSVTVRLEVQTSGWSATSQTRTLLVTAGTTSYPFTFDLSSYPSAKAFRVSTSTGSGSSTTSNQVKKTDCAPPAQVPEVPAPLAIPLTFLATGLVLEGVRRSRSRRDAPMTA